MKVSFESVASLNSSMDTYRLNLDQGYVSSFAGNQKPAPDLWRCQQQWRPQSRGGSAVRRPSLPFPKMQVMISSSIWSISQLPRVLGHLHSDPETRKRVGLKPRTAESVTPGRLGKVFGVPVVEMRAFEFGIAARKGDLATDWIFEKGMRQGDCCL